MTVGQAYSPVHEVLMNPVKSPREVASSQDQTSLKSLTVASNGMKGRNRLRKGLNVL
jgi:hypothetical protein